MKHVRRPAILFFAIAAALLAGCEDKNTGLPPDPVTPPTTDQIAECEKVMKIKFPKSAKFESIDIGVTGSEKRYLLKFTMPASEVDSLVNSSIFRGKKLSSEVRSVGSGIGFKSWFDPSTAEKFRSAQFETVPGKEAQRILIDETRSGEVTVYIYQTVMP